MSRLRVFTRKRAAFFACFVLLLTCEVLIALFVHDRFVRPYIGDVLVVIVIYCLVRTVFPEGIRPLPLYVFAFAAGTELLQLFGLVELFPPEQRIIRTIVGSTFDLIDILCYAVGCGVILVFEAVLRKQRDKN